MYYEDYDPLENVFLSTVVAALPLLTLLYFIALHPRRDKLGMRHLGIAAPWWPSTACSWGLLIGLIALLAGRGQDRAVHATGVVSMSLDS